MNTLPTKVSERLAAGIKRFQPIVAERLKSDVNEADTCTIVMRMLCDVFGYDEFSEITAELDIHGAHCDRAIKLDGKVVLLIEVKAIGKPLKDPQVRQATDYAAKHGSNWVVLTNGAHWRIYKMLWERPVGFELVFEFNFCELNAKQMADIELLSLLAKESWHKNKLDVFETKRQILSKFSLAAVILSEPVLDVIRRELKKLSPNSLPGVKIENSHISEVLELDVLKRELLEGEEADAARRKVKRQLPHANKPEKRQDGGANCSNSDELPEANRTT